MGTALASAGIVRRTIQVGNAPDGLHLRPATAFAKLARGFQCTVTIRCDGKVADGRSPTELLMLIALPGTELELELDGPDAEVALEPLLAILTGGEND